ncbi:hypothetical protein BpHYR1_015573 [Brachionus plicatilis]|uniref:Uncharacterized protein n=1 Tax=Brachionus plicatilis TaxID=10195 RepID=A0A3M7S547_BRAPC|nr:hypothetical protein BpHYR1_015573 [Brachionus plicatilis]
MFGIITQNHLFIFFTVSYRLINRLLNFKCVKYSLNMPPKKLAGTAIHLSGSQSYDFLPFQSRLDFEFMTLTSDQLCNNKKSKPNHSLH